MKSQACKPGSVTN